MVQRPGIFPTFFLSGFECSNFLWGEGRVRRNLVAETGHDRHVAEDYRILSRLGIAVAREGIPWPLVDFGGNVDFSILDPYIEAMNATKILPIWDLCHYGYPDGLDPFSDAFVDRFARYCRAAAEYVIPKIPHSPSFFTPINEITFFSYCAGEWGWAAPYRCSRDDRLRLRVALSRAAIAGVNAIRQVDPGARMVHIDPLVRVVAPRDRPDQIEAARHETESDTFLAWDIICGREHPEFGGSPEILDIVGANNYSFGQMEYRESGPHAPLPPDDDRIAPLCDMLATVWERYRRPMIIGETSGLGHGRPDWLRDVMGESLAAVQRGMDLQGVCLFPAVDMPDWHTGEWVGNGICDLVKENGTLKRVPHQPYVDELRRWQKELNRVTELDVDPFSDPVELQDVIDAAHRLNIQPDKNWS
jgi:beta-glucosidase/6-phospho-beta-glucosidase/beta-galactosidase